MVIKGLRVTKDNITLIEKGPTLKIENNGITYIKFKSSIEEYESLLSDGYVSIDLVGHCGVNSYYGNSVKPQIIILDIEIGQKVDYYF